MSDSESYYSENIDDDEGYCDPFMMLLENREDIVLSQLRRDLIDIDIVTDDNGESLLQWAIKHYCRELAEYLINAGCDVNVASCADGKTPLDEAINRGNDRIIDLLREHGAKTKDELGDEEDC